MEIQPDARSPMSNAQVATMLEELAIAQRSAAQLKEELKAIQDSPAWRFITAYRKWLQKGQASAPVRLVDKAARFAIRKFLPSSATTPTNGASAGSVQEPAPDAAKGELIHCLNPVYKGKIFYLRNNKRHWVMSEQHIACWDTSVALSKVVMVSDEQMKSYEVAGPLPVRWGQDAWDHPIRKNPHTLREIASSKLRGTGIEFGPGTSPMSVPLDCEVKYADRFTEQQLIERSYEAQGTDWVHLTYVMSMDDMSQIPAGSLDFVIAGHVIEHLANPIRAFAEVYRSLKPGGFYVLAIPDMTRIFDRDRQITPLAHLIEDYEHPSKERDDEHYVEFLSKAFNVPDHQLAERVKHAIATGEDLHFHTFTYESFGAMVEYIRQKVAPYRSVWSQPAIEDDPGHIEFYYVMQK